MLISDPSETYIHTELQHRENYEIIMPDKSATKEWALEMLENITPDQTSVPNKDFRKLVDAMRKFSSGDFTDFKKFAERPHLWCVDFRKEFIH